MPGHELWHVVVLAATLFGAAAGVLLVLMPVLFDPPPRGLVRARPLMIGIVMLAALVFALEWLVVH